MIFYLYIYSHILVTVVKELIEQGQQIKRTLDNSFQEQKYLSHLFSCCIKEWNNLREELRKLNQQFNLKWKFSVSNGINGIVT